MDDSSQVRVEHMHAGAEDEERVLTLLMPRMSLAGSKPMGSSMRFTAKKMEFPAYMTQLLLNNYPHRTLRMQMSSSSSVTGVQHHSCHTVKLCIWYRRAF